MDTLLTTTDLQGYDTIVAVTQNNINGNFKFLFGREDGIKPTIDLQVKGAGASLQGTIRPPSVLLRHASDPHKVVFRMDIVKGTLNYWQGFGPEAQKRQQPISQWTIGLVVNLSMADAEARHLPDAVLKQVKNLGDGALSVRQLFMDLQTADIASWDPATTVLPAELRDDADANASFALLMQKYLSQLRDDGHHILGYAIRVANPNAMVAVPPSFPPTDLDFIVNRYTPPVGVPDDPGLDTLCYLMMTEHRPRPTRLPDSFGNWAGSRDEFGCIAQSRRTFVDGFLLPHLALSVNLSTQLNKVSDQAISVSTTRGAQFTGVTPLGGIYEQTQKLKLEYPEGAGNTDVTWTAQHNTWVEVRARGNTIGIAGRSQLRMDLVHWWGIRDRAAHTPISVGVELNWRIEVQLAGVVGGALEVRVGPLQITSKDTRELDWLGELTQALAPGFKDSVDQNLNQVVNIVNRAVDPQELQRRISDALNATQAFVFPGGRDFRLFAPRFTDRGDLLANLRWELG